MYRFRRGPALHVSDVAFQGLKISGPGAFGVYVGHYGGVYDKAQGGAVGGPFVVVVDVVVGHFRLVFVTEAAEDLL